MNKEQQYDYINGAIQSICVGDIHGAIGQLIMLQHRIAEVDKWRGAEERLPKPPATDDGHVTIYDKRLPKMKPVKENKRKSPTKPGVARCGTCGAKPGENCWYMTSAGKYGEVDTKRGQRPEGSYHKGRGKS